jgi:hypothetical protein
MPALCSTGKKNCLPFIEGQTLKPLNIKIWYGMVQKGELLIELLFAPIIINELLFAHIIINIGASVHANSMYLKPQSCVLGAEINCCFISHTPECQETH